MLKVLLNVKMDPIQDISRLGIYSISFKRDNKDFMRINMMLRKFQKILKEHNADLQIWLIVKN